MFFAAFSNDSPIVEFTAPCASRIRPRKVSSEMATTLFRQRPHCSRCSLTSSIMAASSLPKPYHASVLSVEVLDLVHRKVSGGPYSYLRGASDDRKARGESNLPRKWETTSKNGAIQLGPRAR